MTVRCPVSATFRVGIMPAAGAQPLPARRDVAIESLAATVASWRWPGAEAVDEESQAAFAAWSRGELPMFLSASNLSWPSQVPLLLDHRQPPVGVLHNVRRDGEVFSLRGWAEPEYLRELQARRFLSPGIRSTVVRFNNAGPIHFVDVRDAYIVELSACADPLLEDTKLVASAPQRVPAGEFFQLDPRADMETF